MRLTATAAAILVCALALISSFSPAYADNIKKTSTTSVKSSTAAKNNLPETNVTTITVSPGDNLSELAGQYKTTIARLYDANLNITNPDLIYPSEKLVIPGAKEVLTPRPFPSDNPTSFSSPAPVATAPAPDPQPTNIVSAAAVTSPDSSTPTASDNSSNGVWYAIAQCESGGNWSTDTGNGFYGGLQFTLSSWQAEGGVGYPNQASPAEQIAIAEKLQSVQGWSAWPVCSAKLGL